MKILGCALIAAVCLSAAPAHAWKKKSEQAAEPAPAAAGGCAASYKQEGNFIAGRRFTVSDVVPGVSSSVAFKRIYAEGVKSGLKVASSEEKMGSIQFEQTNAGKSWTSDSIVAITWSVLIEPEGKGVRISVSKITPPSYSTGKDFQIKSMCAVVDAARNK